MRTNISTAVTNRNVFGFGQDRVVVSPACDSCAHAAQHLESRHASKRACGLTSALKRPWSWAVVMAGVARMAKFTYLAITGPRRLRVRPMSPALVRA